MPEKNTVDVYKEQFEGVRRRRLEIMIDYMRENHPDIDESMMYKMPTYKLEGKKYISFAPMKNYFSLYLCETAILQEIKQNIPKANIGVGCARIRYSEPEEMLDILKKACDHAIELAQE